MRVRTILALVALALLFWCPGAAARCLHGLRVDHAIPEERVLPEARLRPDPECVFALGSVRADAIALPHQAMTAAEIFRRLAEHAHTVPAPTDFVQSWDRENLRRERISLREFFRTPRFADQIVVDWSQPSAPGELPPSVHLRTPPASGESWRLRDPRDGSFTPLSAPPSTQTVPPLDEDGVPIRYRIDVALSNAGGARPLWVDLGGLDLWGRATPAQRFFATHQEVATLVTDWSTGSLRLTPLGPWAEPSGVFDELLVAAAANELWLARGPEIVADLAGYLDAEPRALRVPDAVVNAWMTRWYGEAGRALTPTMSDWRGVLEGLSLCHIREYLPEAPAVGAAVPETARCVPLRTLVELPADVIGRGERRYRVTHEHRARIISMDPAARDEAIERRVEAIAMPGEAERETWPYLAVRGDRLRFAVAGARPWSSCVAGRCAALNQVDGFELVLDVARAGVIEIRPGRQRGLATRQGIALLRIVALDPDRDVLPVGLTRGASGERPWESVPRDADDTFGFARRSQRVAFGLALDATSVAAWNRRALSPEGSSRTSVFAGDLAFVTARVHPPGETGAPAVAMLVSRSAACPTTSLRALRASVPLDPTEVPVDGRFYVHLVQGLGDAVAPRCLARVGFRVRPERLLASRWPVQLGALGDPRAAATLTGPYALGALLPLLYSRLHLPGGFAIEVGTHLGAFVSLEAAALHRAGFSTTLDLAWGVPRIPRLLAAGGICDLWTYDSPGLRVPVCAAQVSLNLGALYDVIGGR